MRELHKHDKGILLRGIIAVIFGTIALFAPTLGFEIIILYFGAFALIDGIVAFIVGVSAKSSILILEGVVGILVGLYVFFFTAQAAAIFLLLISIWAIASGILEIIAGIELRKHIKNEIWLMFVGIISILFGVFVFINPIVAALAITFVIGIYAIIFGLFLIALAQRVKTLTPKKSSSKKKKKR
jgi:uncharacterized membrane protein HdeD (DUF308 family)